MSTVVALVQDPILRFTFNDGTPAVGGSLLTQVGGVNFPTYSESTGTIQFPNPIILNARGEIATQTGVSSPLFVVPNVAYQYTLSDAQGNVIWTAPNITSPSTVNAIVSGLTPSSLGQVLWPQTPQESTAVVIPINFNDIPGNAPSGDIARYGVVYGGADSTLAFQQALNVGGEITIAGAVNLASSTLATLANSGLALQSNTTLRCVNGGSISITGTTGCNLFYSTNVSNIELIDLNVMGNGSAATNSTGYVWYSLHTAGATQNAQNHKIIRGSYTNFGGFYWFYWDNTAAATFTAQQIEVAGVNFYSQSGNNQGQSSILITAAMLGFSGSNTVTSTYTIEDVDVHDCYAMGTFVKQFCIFWSGNLRCAAHHNHLVGFGSDSGTLDDQGSYALLAYDFAHGAALAPNEIVFDNNIIDVVRDCGIYCASPNRIAISNNTITGQTSQANNSLPKAAIAINDSVYCVCNGNKIFDSWGGVTAVLATGCVAIINDTVIVNTTATGTGIYASPAGGGSGTFGAVYIDGLDIISTNATVTGVQIYGTSVIGLGIFVLKNFYIAVAQTGIEQLDILGGVDVPLIGRVHISNGEIANASNYGIVWNGVSSAATRATIEQIVFYNPIGNVIFLNVAGSTGLTIRDITFNDMQSGSGACFDGLSTWGTLEGIRYVNVAAARRYIASSLGTLLPTGFGADNDFVQNLNPTETGSGGSKYIVTGYQYDNANTQWVPCRSLTGN